MEKQESQNAANEPTKFTADDLLKMISKNQKKKPPTDKAKLYLNKYPTVNEAFAHARCEDRETLQSIFNEGVDINFDANKKINMFSWAITAHGACDPYFLELMYMHGRKDIKENVQEVFDFACGFGHSRHINVFMKHRDEYPLDIFRGMKGAVVHRNRDNLHHLLIYMHPNSEQIQELWKIAYNGFSSSPPLLLYMATFFGSRIDREAFIESLPKHFYDTLYTLMKIYLMDNKPFEIGSLLDETAESGFSVTIDNILRGTDDGIQKLKLLHDNGFEIFGYNAIMDADPSALPKPTSRRYYTNSM